MEELVRVQKSHHHDVAYVDLDLSPKPEVVDYLKASVLCDSAFIKNTTDGELNFLVSFDRDLQKRVSFHVTIKRPRS